MSFSSFASFSCMACYPEKLQGLRRIDGSSWRSRKFWISLDQGVD
jgi:hypothetical protein